MSTDLSLDSVLYVACEEQPFIEDNGCIGNESKFYILGGTHYLSALRKVFQDKTEKCLVNAAIYVDLTDEEILWLGSQHNNKQHQFRQISAQDYIINFRRLLCQSHNVDDIDPPSNPPKDWRMKCQSLLPEGKSINSYSPWLGISRVDKRIWSLVTRTFHMFSNGEVKGTSKKGKNLESHRLWRQIVSLTPSDGEKVLKGIVNQQFSIAEAIQDAENRKCLKRLRGVMEEQLSLDWSAINERFGSLVSAEALLPFAR
ncbi:PREDICTED: uncharacterized protein LOC107353584 [Acropora digitifera]|uniref:uncharacterized protein LOC107353584 n=1 Tax=Acropora digitifera TaxID=70779 RepID=UPI00077A95C0|nr:PREDICTED: uncharacterized protein LOC107353584 [Acropora digitifera]